MKEKGESLEIGKEGHHQEVTQKSWTGRVGGLREGSRLCSSPDPVLLLPLPSASHMPRISKGGKFPRVQLSQSQSHSS